MLLRIVSIVLLIIQASCTTIGEGNVRDAMYFGFVRVKSKSTIDNGYLEKIRVLGVWNQQGRRFGSSTGLGFQSSEQLVLPRGCQIVILVGNVDAKRQLETLIEPMVQGGHQPCIVTKD